MSETKDLAKVVQELHAKQEVSVVLGLTSEGKSSWLAKLKGDDFLDGPWSRNFSGETRSHAKSLKAAVKAVTKRGRR